MTPLFAVHLSDGQLDWPWLAGGFALLALGVALGCRRATDREIPRIGVLTAAFFVASQVHIPLGVTSVHLLLNGLLGVVLRHRAMPAIAVGLFLQTMLFGHGGKVALGVNWCTMALPAVLAGFLFPLIRTSPLGTNRFGRGAGVFAASTVWLGIAVTAAQILIVLYRGQQFDFKDPPALWALDPVALVGLAAVSALLAVFERRLEPDPDFALGLFVGVFACGLTVLSVFAAAWYGGKDDLRGVAASLVLAHVPVIAIEGLGVGFAVAVLAKAKPDWLPGSRDGPSRIARRRI